jgi:hypothetical protein
MCILTSLFRKEQSDKFSPSKEGGEKTDTTLERGKHSDSKISHQDIIFIPYDNKGHKEGK